MAVGHPKLFFRHDAENAPQNSTQPINGEFWHKAADGGRGGIEQEMNQKGNQEKGQADDEAIEDAAGMGLAGRNGAADEDAAARTHQRQK